MTDASEERGFDDTRVRRDIESNEGTRDGVADETVPVDAPNDSGLTDDEYPLAELGDDPAVASARSMETVSNDAVAGEEVIDPDEPTRGGPSGTEGAEVEPEPASRDEGEADVTLVDETPGAERPGGSSGYAHPRDDARESLDRPSAM